MAQNPHTRDARHQLEHVPGQSLGELQRAAHRVIGVGVDRGTEHQLAPVGLAHIHVQRARHHHRRQEHLHRLGDSRLQRMGGDGQTHAGHGRDERRPSSSAVDDDRRGDVAPVRANTGHPSPSAFAVGTVTAFAENVGDLRLLVHLDAHVVRCPGVSPHHRVVADDAAGRVIQGALDRVAGVVGGVEARALLLDLVGADHAGVDTAELVDLGAPVHRAQGGVGVGQRQVAPLAEHHVDVQLHRHLLIQVHRAVVEGHPFGGEVVGAHDGGVAPRAAAAQVGLVEHGHIGHAVIAGQVIGGGQTVHAAADHHGVVGPLQVAIAPHPRPRLAPETLPGQRRSRILGRTFPSKAAVPPHRSAA